MRRMDIADFKAGAVARESPWPESREPAFVGQLRQRVNLIHELRKLTAAEEIPYDRRERFGIDQFLRGHAFHALIEKGHALLDQALGAGQTDPALIGEQFAHGADTTAAEVIDVVQAAFALFKAEQ